MEKHHRKETSIKRQTHSTCCRRLVACIHPIVAGIEAFRVHDEFYIQEYAPRLEIHMVAIDRGVVYPMVWTKAERQGHVAFSAMGHDERAWSLPSYSRLLLQAAAWLMEQNGEVHHD